MSQIKKTVRITESKLIDMINDIVTETVSVKKQEWLAEQAAKGDKNAIMEQKVNNLEQKINQLLETKK